MRIVLLTLLVAISSFNLLAQKEVNRFPIETIPSHLRNLDSLWEGYSSLQETKPDSAVFLLQGIIHIAEQEDNLDWLAGAYAAIGYIKQEQGYLGVAATNYYHAINILEQLKNQDIRLADNLGNLSLIFRASKQHKLAIDAINKAINLLEANTNTHQELTNAYRNKSIFLLDIDEYDSALYIAEKGLSIAISNNIEANKVYYYNLIGTIHSAQKEYKQALHFYNQGLTLESNSLTRAYLLNNAADSYLNQNEFATSKRLLHQSIKLTLAEDSLVEKRFEEIALTRSSYNLLAELALKERKIDSSIFYLNKCISLAPEKMVDEESNIYQTLQMLSEVLSNNDQETIKLSVQERADKLATCNDLTLQYLHQLQGLKDNLESLNKQYAVNFATEKYILGQKLRTAEAKRAQIWQAFWIPVVFTVLLLIGFLYMVSRLKKVRRFVSEIDFLMED